MNNSRKTSGLFNSPYSTALRRDYHSASKMFSDGDYYNLEDLDNPDGWEIKELEMITGMGFSIEGNDHLGLSIDNAFDSSNNYTIAKHKKLGYELAINGRKHYFKSFDKMIDHIDEYGEFD